MFFEYFISIFFFFSQAKKARRKFLRGEQVVYGKGRLTSSHRQKGSIEYPWGFVGVYYEPVGHHN